MPSKNDVAWEALFENHRILDHIDAEGVYQISASIINELREARLMTKFDHRIKLPSVFKQHELTIQPQYTRHISNRPVRELSRLADG